MGDNPTGIEGLKANEMGRGFKLEKGGSVAIFDATPPGFYGFQIRLVPEGEIQFFLSNQGAADDGREGKKEVRDEG